MPETDIIEYKEGNLKILGISIWKLFAYFILYSFLGYVIETIFGIFTKGLWESRQSFLYGPFLRNLWSRSSYYNTIFTILQKE